MALSAATSSVYAPGKMWASLVVSLAVLLPLANANYGPIGDCHEESVNSFIAALPNPNECGQAYLTLQSQENVSMENYNAALATFCTPDCGHAIAKFSAAGCGDMGRVSGFLFLHYCLPRETGSDRCRSSFLDKVNATFESVQSSCLPFDTNCPEGCAEVLQMGATEIGCCYQSIYNNTDVLNAFEALGQLPMEALLAIHNLSNPALWNACNVSLESVCTGNPFPGESTLEFGVCTAEQLQTFLNTTDPSCNKNYARVFDVEEALEDICRPDCAGKVATDYLSDTCQDIFSAEMTPIYCYRTEGRLGGRCFFSMGASFINDGIFYDAGSTCLQSGTTCPDGCASGLRKIKDQLGCCYQTIYNDTAHLDGLFITREITIEEHSLFRALSSWELWDRCGVAIQPRCTGDPYAPAGALKFAASMVTVMSVITLSLIL